MKINLREINEMIKAEDIKCEIDKLESGNCTKLSTRERVIFEHAYTKGYNHATRDMIKESLKKYL